MDSPILCKCGNNARRVTVKKEGKNKGREFYQCKGIEKRCGLLLWVDEMEKSNNKSEPKPAAKSSDDSGSESDSDSDSPILCKCGNEARRVTVKKEGKNQGREFYQCKGIEKRCGLLLWVDEMKKSNTKKQSTTKPTPEKRKIDDDSDSASDEITESLPLCKCDKETRRVTVKKEGKNQGREFYQCKGREKRCGLLLWVDEMKKSNTKKQSATKPTPEKRKIDDDSDSASGEITESLPLCKCDKETRRLTVKKEGKNQGREFYQCKGVEKRCGFMKWIDENSSKKSKVE